MKSSTVLMTGPWSLLYYNSVSLKIMSLGKKIVFTPTARPVKMMLQVIRDCKVDVIFGTSDYFYEMANNSCPTDDYFENLKIIYCGGTRLNAEMAEKLQKSFPKVQIRHSFGSTECGVITRYSVGDISKPGSIGRVCPGRTVKVVDLHTRALLGPNQVGEMCVKSPTLMQGYLDLELADYIDEDNFFMTGDLAYYDKNNYLFFVERTSNFIWWQDHKVSPGELENVLLQHPAVCDVVVIGRPAPVVKEVPVAIVVKKPGTDVSEDQLIEFVASQVSPPMQLRGGVYFISEIPKTAGGKPMRLQLKEMLNKNLST